MPFSFTEQHIVEYYRDGYTVFRAILPVSLISDLRRETDKLREIARENRGPQAQRIGATAAPNLVDARPFREYKDLPELNDACQRVLSPQHTIEGGRRLSVLFEPAEEPWNTWWHRDVAEDAPGMLKGEVVRLSQDPSFFTQVNCALYTDASLWYVPGSDIRPDFAREVQASQDQPDLEGLGNEERERLGLEHCHSMPDAVNLVLEPGDFALYRPRAWHLGNYAPYLKRATLHHSVWKPETRDWYEAYGKRAREAQKAAESESAG